MVLQIVRVVLFLPTAFYKVKVFFFLKDEHSRTLLILRALMLLATIALQVPEALAVPCSSRSEKDSESGSAGHRTRSGSSLDDALFCT